MKIGIIFPKDSEAIFDSTSSRTFGGATVQMYSIANELTKHKECDVFCVTPKINNKEADKNTSLKIIEVFNFKKSILGTIFLFHKNISTERPDVLIQHGLTLFSCLLSLYCKLYKIKFVFMFAHDVEVQGRYQSSKKKCALFQILINTATVLITQNKYQQDFLFKEKGRNSILIRMGFTTPELGNSLKESILWVARCESWKQPELYIDLARKFPAEKFIMISPKVVEKYFEEIKSKAEKVPNLTFIDFAQFGKTWEYFKKAKIFVNTSVLEGFPQTFVQAVMCGTPIISLNANPDNFITENECGFYCAGDTRKLSDNISKIVGNKQLYDNISHNCLGYGIKNHDIVKSVESIINIIKQ